MATKKYIIAIRTSLSRKGITEDIKETIVLSFTEGRTKSLRDMSDIEAIGMLKSLNNQPDTYDQPDKKLRMKRKILAYAHELGWELETGKVDMTRVNQYCIKRGHLQKPFNDYTVKELSKLIQQFQQMHRAYLKSNP